MVLAVNAGGVTFLDGLEATMNNDRGARPVVVGFDGSGAGDAAFDWARAEAQRQGVPLELLATRAAMYAAPGFGATAPWPEDLTGELEAEARRYAEERSSETDVRVVSEVGTPARSLVDASRRASVVVVGRHPHGAVVEALWGSTSAQVVAHAACPVVVVDRPFMGASAAPVVVGLDGSDESRAALEFGFRRASDLRAPLIAVHAWWVDLPDHMTSAWLNEDFIERLESSARSVLDDSLAPWIEKFPDVRVRKVLKRQYPAQAVLDEADDAQLVVVGSRGHGGFAGLLLGSVSQGLLHHTGRPCPLAVVHSASSGDAP